MKRLKSIGKTPLPVERLWTIVFIATLGLIVASCGPEAEDAAGGQDSGANQDDTTTDESDADAGGDGESVVFQAGHVLTESEPHHQIALEVAENVENRTEGRIQIQVFPSSQLGSEGEMFEQASAGAEVIAWGGTDRTGEYAVPEAAILLGPYLMDDPLEDFQTFADSDLMAEWTEELASEAGLRILAMNWYFGDRHIISDNSFEEPSELSNVAVRVPPSPVFLNIFETLDASPVTLEWAEVYTGLSQGVVDAAEAPLSTLHGSNLHEVADTVTMTGHINSTVGWTMSEDVFQRLSEQDQQVLVEEFRAGGERARDAFVEQEEEFRGLLEDEGVEIIEVGVDEYREATLDFYNQFPEWPDDLREQVRAAVE